jgi:hypothetical protein
MTDFTEHESGLDTDAGDVGGDVQAGPAISRRFQKQLADGNWAVVTEYAFASLQDGEEGKPVRPEGAPWGGDELENSYRQYDVTNMTEFLVCRDPEDAGGTEVWSDYTYDYPSATGFNTETAATEWATGFIKRLTTDLYPWDGEPIQH